MTERPDIGARGDRDAVVTGQEPDGKRDRAIPTPDDSTPAGAERPFAPSVPDDVTRADS